jgi:hypothetical protein
VDKTSKISLTLEISPYELRWLSKLFCIMDESEQFNCQDGSEAGKKLEEIQKLINEYKLKMVDE